MTEPQDVLAEALEGQNLYHGRHGTTPAGKATAMAILSSLATRGYALVRTPETLDVEGDAWEKAKSWKQRWVDRWKDGPATVAGQELARRARIWIGYGLPMYADLVVQAEQETWHAALAASPAPDPGAVLREALEDAMVTLHHISDDAEFRVSALRVALAPSAEPPETA